MPRKRARGVRRNEQQWTDGVPLSSLQRWQRRLRSVPAAKVVELVSPVSLPPRRILAYSDPVVV